MSDINKHGLSRNIPPSIKREIRVAAGFGCVMCGSIIYEYEHIEPTFKDAKEHGPHKMTLLCSLHHDKVSKKIISKKKIWEDKNNPTPKKTGKVKVKDILESYLFTEKKLII